MVARPKIVRREEDLDSRRRKDRRVFREAIVGEGRIKRRVA